MGEGRVSSHEKLGVALNVRKAPEGMIEFRIHTSIGTAVASLPLSEAVRVADAIRRYESEILN